MSSIVRSSAVVAIAAGLALPAAAQTPAQQQPAQPATAPTQAQSRDTGGAQIGAGLDRNQVDPNFRLGPGDLLEVSVLEDASLDRQVLVRPDGRISVPLAGSPMAAGRTPEQVAAAIRSGLADDFIEPPTVTVALSGYNPGILEQQAADFPTVYIVGEVQRPGPYQVQDPVNFLQAMALAGGPGIFAAKKRIQVRQRNDIGEELVTLVDYEALEDGFAQPSITLGDGDTIFVPERGLFE